jgi:hypothetical protein
MIRWSGRDSIRNIARWNGEEWSGLGSGLDWSGWDMVLDRDDLYIAGAFRHAGGKNSHYIALWHDPTLSVEIERQREPADAIAGTTPNPFRQTVTISLQIPERSEVALQILDPNGRIVHLVHEKSMSPGTHSFRWEPGADQASGFYIVRCVVGTTILTRKIIYVRD